MIAFSVVTRKCYGSVTNPMDLLLMLEGVPVTHRSLTEETLATRATFRGIYCCISSVLDEIKNYRNAIIVKIKKDTALTPSKKAETLF